MPSAQPLADADHSFNQRTRGRTDTDKKWTFELANVVVSGSSGSAAGSFFRLWLSAFLLLFSVASSPAQTLGDRQFRVAFDRGQTSATIREDVFGRDRVIYILGARAGQTMDVRLSSTTRLVEFLIYSPEAWPNGRPLASSSLVGALVPELNRYVGKLPSTGDYRIVVRHVRELALPGQQSRFRLDISVTGGASADGGLATQLPGGTAVDTTSAYWKVVGLGAGDSLNVRSGPGTSYRVLDRLAMGEVVRNEGCAMSGGAQWCEVSRPAKPREIGWVSARYLSPSRAPQAGGATQLPGDAIVGGSGYNATGNLTCLIGDRVRQCPFGVIRGGQGKASLYVTLPSGKQRRIEFVGGRPVSSNGQGGIYGEWTGAGAILVFIGTGERFTVEDAILSGG